jgi:uncharacterized membrane protein YebE (DUF533 family)
MRYVALAALLAVTACAEADAVIDREVRGQAKSAVNGVVQSQFPGVNAAPVTDCIIDNASRAEIFQVARSSVTGADPETAQLVLQIAQRPETVKCILNNGVLLLG